MLLSYSFLWDGEHLCFGISNDRGKCHASVYSLKLLNLNNLNICDNLLNYENKSFVMAEKIQHPIQGNCLLLKYS